MTQPANITQSPFIEADIVTLVFNNADAIPKSEVLRVHRDAVARVMAWYGAYYAGDRYTVTVDGRNVRMDQNGEPTA